MNADSAVARLQAVRGLIARSAHDSGRDPAAVTLIAVSKMQATEAIRPVLDAGQRVFGENYVQEARAKWKPLREQYPDAELHLIGPLQSNKAREAVSLFDAIHSLDRPSLAEALAKAIDREGRRPRLFAQVNTGEEPQKGGVWPAEADAFITACRDCYGLTLHGVMGIPPVDDPPSAHFGLLHAIARRNGLAGLSMGMSADMEAAIQLGATHVRVGTAIFGARPPA